MSMSQSSCLLMVAKAENVRLVEYVGSYESSKNAIVLQKCNNLVQIYIKLSRLITFII